MYALVPVCIYKVRFVLFQASNYGNLCQRTSPEFCAVLPGMKVLLWAVARAMSSIHWSLPRGGVLQPSYSCIQSMHAVGYAWMVWNTYWQRFLTYWGNSSNMLGVSSSCCKHDLLHWLVEHSHRELVRIRSQSPQVYIHLQVHATCVWFGVLAKRHTFPMKTGDIWPPLLQLFTAQGDSSGLLHCHLLFY